MEVGPGDSGLVPAAAAARTSVADRSVAGPHRGRPVRAWPLLVLAAPAAVAVWSGWVGIGTMTGFGQIHPLPGIWDSLHLNTAITLPIGVEAYAAYALRIWLASGLLVSRRTRQFAKWSAIASLLLGMAGQVAYHLLTEAGARHAPWGITTAVSCLPVLVLGMGTALTHMVRSDAHADGPDHLAANHPPGWSAHDRNRDHPDRPADGRRGPAIVTQLATARAAARQLNSAGIRVSRRSLRSAGVRGSNADLGALAQILGTELNLPSATGNPMCRARAPATLARIPNPLPDFGHMAGRPPHSHPNAGGISSKRSSGTRLRAATIS
jgi:hypothetical protein